MNRQNDAMPDGVTLCPTCSEPRSGTLTATDELSGEVYLVRSTCLCEGRPCSLCGEMRIRKTGSDYWDAARCEWRHVPMAGAFIRLCTECSDRTGRPRTG